MQKIFGLNYSNFFTCYSEYSNAQSLGRNSGTALDTSTMYCHVLVVGCTLLSSIHCVPVVWSPIFYFLVWGVETVVAASAASLPCPTAHWYVVGAQFYFIFSCRGPWFGTQCDIVLT